MARKLCRTDCFCNTQWKDTVASCHCSICRWSWLLHHQSYWGSWVEISTIPHLWTSPRCCQTWHTHQGWSDWTTCHYSVNLKLFSKHPLLPQYNHLLLLQHPSKLQPEDLQQQPTPSRWQLQLPIYNTDWKNLCHTLLIWSCQEGIIMPYWTDVNTTVIMREDKQVHLCTADQDLKTLKDSAYLPDHWHTPTIHSLSLT